MKVSLGMYCAALAAAVLISTPAHASKPVVTVDTYAQTIDSSCVGELIDFTVTETTSVSTSIVNGIVHADWRFRIDGTGVGETTGNTYQIHEVFSEVSNTRLDPITNTGEENRIITGILIGQGSAPNERVKFSMHMTVNANGDITVEREIFTDDCNV